MNRITSGMATQAQARRLQEGLQRLSQLQDQASSQRAITKPSDDPAAASRAMAVRGEQTATSQYARNITDGISWLSTVDSTLGNATNIMQRVRDLTVQGANSGALNQSQRSAIADELDSLKTDLMTQANTQYLGRPIFAGSSDTGSAFAADYSYSGSTDATVERRIDASTTVRVDADGAAAFGTGSTSTFALIDSISADLRAGTDIGGRVDEVDQAITSLTTTRATAGLGYTSLQRAQSFTASAATTLESTRAGLEDVDLADVIVQLQLQQTSYQAALQVTSKALQPSLMSFLS